MPRFRTPTCVAPDPDDRKTGRCGVLMTILGERHESFGPNWRPGHTVFVCPRCAAIRAISEETAERYVESYR